MAQDNLTEVDLERYLEENPNFARRYFVENAQSGWVDEWLGKRSHRPSIHQPVTNLQKISISSSDSVLRPLVTIYPLSKSPTSRSTLQKLYGLDGQDSSSESEDDDEGNENLGPTKIDRQGLRTLNEKDLFMQLIRDIANELDINKLSHKILVNVSLLTNGDRCSLFLVKGKSSKRYLVSRLFDVTSTSTLEESLRPEGNEIIIPIGVGIAGTTAVTGECINIKEAYEDPRFNREVDKQTGYVTHSILCMPIKSPDGMVIGIAQVINKKSGDHQFTEKDEEVFRDYLTFCGIGITNAQLFEVSVQEFKRNQTLVSLAKNIFETTEVVADVVKTIMTQAQELLDCERCTVYLVDTEADESEGVVFSQIFDLNANEEMEVKEKSSNLSSVYQGLAMRVVESQEGINIADIDKSSKDFEIDFNGDICSSSKVTSVLCTPIFNRKHKVIGVAQLMNKRNGHPFTENDDGLFQAFAIFCGLGIYNTQMYEKIFHLITKQSLAIEQYSIPRHDIPKPLIPEISKLLTKGKNHLDLLSYHASAPLEETKRFQEMEVPDGKTLGLLSFALDDMKLTDDETCLAGIRMFMDLELLSKFKIQYKVMCRWILTVKRNYRPVTYHNWRHAFNVAQTMFAMFTTGEMAKWFTDLEILILLVACFCHDLDHRGTNNSFQTKVDSPIARLYTTSTMEHHHFDQSVMILNSEDNNIFACMSREQYQEAMTLLKHAILSTDLAVYFKKRDDFKQCIESNETDWKKESNIKVLRAMMMTACDLSAITKPWSVQVRVAEMVSNEFFEQGDMERSQLHLEPVPMMDRQKKNELPKLQVGFINFVCMPLYQLLPKMNQNLQPLLDGITSNKTKWQKLAEETNTEDLQKEVDDETKPLSDESICKDKDNRTKNEESNAQTDTLTETQRQTLSVSKSVEYESRQFGSSPKRHGSSVCALL